MCGKIGQNRRMPLTAAPMDELADASDLVGQMVCKAEGRVGSRVLAYDEVGRKIGKSGSWVYRLTNGAHVGLSLKTWRAIAAAYAKHAEALAAAAEASRLRTAALEAEADRILALRAAVEKGGD